MTNQRAAFGSKLGMIMATVGASVGLGNMWRFPYVMGANGGAAFLIVYLICVLLLGFPLVLAEFIIGRRSKSNAVTAFKVLAPGSLWYVTGLLGVLTSLLILGFYVVVTGWTLYYLLQSAAGNLSSQTPEQYAQFFQGFVRHPRYSFLCTCGTILLSYSILNRGVSKGIERASSILMPLLFLLLIGLSLRSVLLPNSHEGLLFIFRPDFGKLSMQAILTAMGQAFLSLSIGLGGLITYSSYYKEHVQLVHTAGQMAIFDTLVALISGVMIFPAVFSFGLEPTSGPSLVFLTLPNVFRQMEASSLWATLFYLLLFIAALTSIIFMHESVSTFVAETFQLRRQLSIGLVSLLIFLLAIPCTLSFSCLSDFTVAGKTIFDLSDYLTGSFMIPISGILISVFVGWRLGKTVTEDELSNHGKLPMRFTRILVFILRYVAPVGIFIVLLSTILDLQ